MTNHSMASIKKTTEATTSNREEADNYDRVVAVLDENWRIIECRGEIQWILQRRSGNRNGQPRWAPKKFHRNKRSLIRTVYSIVGVVDPTILAILFSLPDWFGGRP